MSSKLKAKTIYKDILQLSAQARYDFLKGLDDDELYWEVIQLLPVGMWDELMWFEKCVEVMSSLTQIVPIDLLWEHIHKSNTELESSNFSSLANQWSEGDELWKFDGLPGDKGYALLRNGRIVDYCILETNSIHSE